MTKSSYILLLCIALMIFIGAEVWRSTGGNDDQLPTINQVATPIATTSLTESLATSTTLTPAPPTSTKPTSTHSAY